MRIAGVATNDPGVFDRFLTLHEGPSDTVERFGSSDQLVAFAASGPTGVSIQADNSGSGIVIEADVPIPGGDIDRRALTLLENLLRGNTGGMTSGQQSVAIWNGDRSEMSVWRDRAGNPPVFYATSADTFAWSTALSPLTELFDRWEPDDVARTQYQLTGFVFAPRTFYKGIHRLPAASVITHGSLGESVNLYWRPSFAPKLTAADGDPGDLVWESIVAATEVSIGEGTNPVLALSSGIDSMTLAVVTAKELGYDVPTYTFNYNSYDGFLNESRHAESVAKALGLDHVVIELTPDYVMSELPRLLSVYEEPFTYGLHSARMEQIREAGFDHVINGTEGAEWRTSQAFTRSIRLAR